MMRVSDALATRRSVRGFLDTPIDVDLIQALVVQASRAPSGGNLQPWHIDIVAGEAMTRLKAIMADLQAAGKVEAAEYDIYPHELVDPYRARRFAVGMALYETMGIARDDAEARAVEFRRNFQFFGAPVALFMTLDRRMGPPQWSDCGMFLQSFMLLAVESGLATCAQECWAIYPETVRAFLGTPDERMLFCGMAVGYEDIGVRSNALRTERADTSEWLKVRVN